MAVPRSNRSQNEGGQHSYAAYPQSLATVLAELAEQIDPKKLAVAARTTPLPWAQRLGYLLERVGAVEQAVYLKRYVQGHATKSVAVLPRVHGEDAPRSADWKLIINAAVEAET